MLDPYERFIHLGEFYFGKKVTFYFAKNGCFSGRIRPDWENSAWADMAGLGSIGLIIPVKC